MKQTTPNTNRKDLLLSIDCGTQSLRVMLFDIRGKLLFCQKQEYCPYTSPHPGWAEQNPEIFWSALEEGCLALKDLHPEYPSRVSGIGVTTQRDSMICLDRNGQILYPAIIWLDTRKAPQHYRGNPAMRLVYRIAGASSIIARTQREGKLNWLRAERPEIWDQTWKYVQVSGFLNFRLTGRVVDSTASMVGHIPFSHRQGNWAGPHNLKSKIFPLPKEKQYELAEPGEVIGKLTANAARSLGLPEGLPVVACGSDKSCETLGVGSTGPELASLSFGTTATVEITTRRYFEPLPYLPAYCAALPGAWVPEIEIFRGYWMIRWFKEELGKEEIRRAAERGLPAEVLLDELLDQTPPGNRGLLLQPYWGSGLKDPNARGTILGFGDIHDRPAIYRSIVEGLGFALRDGLETLERRGRISCPRAAASGGASRSNRICQTTADILGRPLVRGETPEASGLGAAILTASALGLHSCIQDAVAAMVRTETVFYPRSEESKLYDRLYRSYRKIYPRLKSIYREIQHITGYPEQ